MKQKAIYLLITSLLFNTLVLSQNLLDTSRWTQGFGSVLGFDRNCNDSENIREYGTGPNGNTVLLWKAVNDVDNNADGGWNNTYVNIDHTKTYRFSVWLKKTNSNDGHSYFGCRGYLNGEHHILYYDINVNNRQYFYAPRIKDNSTAPTIASLLGLDKPLVGNLIDVSRKDRIYMGI